MCCANIQSYIFIYRSCVSLYIGDNAILYRHLCSCFAGRMGLRRAGLSSVSLRLTAPSAEGAVWAALPAKPPLKGEALREGGGGVRSPALAGRGGSVSRRDLIPKTKERAHLSWARKFGARIKPIPSRSSGGSAREGLLSEKPPPSQYPPVSLHFTNPDVRPWRMSLSARRAMSSAFSAQLRFSHVRSRPMKPNAPKA